LHNRFQNAPEGFTAAVTSSLVYSPKTTTTTTHDSPYATLGSSL